MNGPMNGTLNAMTIALNVEPGIVLHTNLTNWKIQSMTKQLAIAVVIGYFAVLIAIFFSITSAIH